MRKTLLLILFSVFLLIVGFYTLNTYIYDQKQATNHEPVKSYQATLTGEYLCLPHRDTTEPQTKGCTPGLKTDTNEYYALDFNLLSQNITDLKSGDRITVVGTITPIELLSTDMWDKYPISGIFSITSPLQII